MKLNLTPYIRLMRLDKPIGTLLLLYPTLWALLLANNGFPNFNIALIFILGVIIMRSAGCVINDFADRHFDGLVKRTKNRPLATGEISEKQAKILFFGLVLIAFLLVIQLNIKTILLSFIALGLASIYPFMKRYIYMPQAVLALAFSFSIPMAFTAQNSSNISACILLFLANACWTIAYDTQYAMVDRDDDIKIGIKSSAILFADYDLMAIYTLQILTFLLFIGVGLVAHLKTIYFIIIFIANALFIYQAKITQKRERDMCFKAFLNNNYVGLIVLLAFFLNFL